ncbi:nickel pincer cofactor biosynthesis protein LarB [Desulfonatronum thioautotrophicum]|uniref:nickel pincer cofactor biosynthesis protein LarB n=1 Tax=Desulfonatronum thioautotrophicum TaxID=617001 RepID=UPI0005EB58FD|nr:nickel pincer cofactor biosynthesis protein LarB [Desulfonatronum thioautotrophicum]
MEITAMRRLFDDVAQGRTTPDKALESLRYTPFMEVGCGVNLDTHRALRTGHGETVFGQGKDPEQMVRAVGGLAASGSPVLATRVNPEQADALRSTYPQGTYWARARLFSLGMELPVDEPWQRQGAVIVACAGAADLPVALEAFGTAAFLGLNTGLVSDVGVAGLHRLQPHMETLFRAKLLIVVAGMEGALPSVLAGLTGKPILAVPTSVGYGASFQGLAALMAMLNSCAPGIAVLNIDNGYGAACMAAKILAQFECAS